MTAGWRGLIEAGIGIPRSKDRHREHRPESSDRRLQGAKDRRGHLRRPLCGHRRGLGRPGPNLETIQNRIWFSLRQGSHTCRSLQAAWNAHGEAGLTFGECERLEDEESSYVRNALLKERMLHWLAELRAEAI